MRAVFLKALNAVHTQEPRINVVKECLSEAINELKGKELSEQVESIKIVFE